MFHSLNPERDSGKVFAIQNTLSCSSDGRASATPKPEGTGLRASHSPTPAKVYAHAQVPPSYEDTRFGQVATSAFPCESGDYYSLECPSESKLTMPRDGEISSLQAVLASAEEILAVSAATVSVALILANQAVVQQDYEGWRYLREHAPETAEERT